VIGELPDETAPCHLIYESTLLGVHVNNGMTTTCPVVRHSVEIQDKRSKFIHWTRWPGNASAVSVAV